MKFEELKLIDPLLKALEDKKHTTPTPIQEKTIPLLIERDIDFVGQAQTGTGKTAAFVLPLLQKLADHSGPSECLILTPTRELAKQVEAELLSLSTYLPQIKTALVYGGSSYDRQIRRIKKDRPSVIVGTPGRVMDLMGRGVLNFSKAKYLILDEADEMLNMGFYEDVLEITSKFNKNRRFWMFSATMPKRIVELIKKQCKNPEIVQMKKSMNSSEQVEQFYFLAPKRKKVEALYRFILSEKDSRGMIFCQTKLDTVAVGQELTDRGLKVECLNGDLAQNAREAAIDRLREGKANFLVCTDVAARGIDISDLSHVYNIGPAQNVESYVHRVGRTGRAGNFGKAITILCANEMGFIRRVERELNKKLERTAIPKISVLKQGLVSQELGNLERILGKLRDKKEDFKVDESFDSFISHFQGLNKEEISKALFTYMFGSKLRKLDSLGEIVEEKVSRNQRPPQRSQRSRRRPIRRRGR